MSSQFQNIVETVLAFEEVIAQRWADDGGSVFVEVRTGGGRSQIVMVRLIQEEGEEILHVLAEIGPADPSEYAAMLRHNLQLRHSRIALVDDEDASHFAVVYAGPLRDTDDVRFTQVFAEAVFTADAIGRQRSLT